MAHSTVVGGSNCGRLIACPASRKLSQEAPRFTGNIYTQQGTALHAAAEIYLVEGGAIEIMDFVGEEYEGYTLTEDDVVHKLMPALDALDDYMDDENIEVYVEESEVHFTDPALAGVFGSADFIGVSADEKSVYVLDFKFGHSPVSPEENSQGLFYAAAALQDPESADFFEKAERIVIGIIQPAVADDVMAWATTVDRLHTFVADLTAAVAESARDALTPAAGPHCQFCPAMAATCHVKKTRVMESKGMTLTKLTLVDILAVADDIEATIKAARKLAHTMIENGEDVEGYKLVPKRATRKWKNPEAVEAYCKKSKKVRAEHYYDQKLRSPAQLEKVFKAKKVDYANVSPYCESVSSGTTLAVESDPRQGVKFSKIAVTGKLPELN